MSILTVSYNGGTGGHLEKFKCDQIWLIYFNLLLVLVCTEKVLLFWHVFIVKYTKYFFYFIIIRAYNYLQFVLKLMQNAIVFIFNSNTKYYVQSTLTKIEYNLFQYFRNN